MKKFYLKPVLLLLFMVSIFSSCEQESLQASTPILENTLENRNNLLMFPDDPIQIREGVVLANGRLIFDDVLDFEQLLLSLETVEHVEAFLESLSDYDYQSLYNSTGLIIEGERVDIPELEAVLNQYGALESNNYLIRLNSTQQESYVIPTTASMLDLYRTEIAEDASDLPIEAVVFPFDGDGDVWEYVTGGYGN